MCWEEWGIGFRKGRHYKTSSYRNISQSRQSHPHTSIETSEAVKVWGKRNYQLKELHGKLKEFSSFSGSNMKRLDKVV
jgi:hypothetical protein